ncbi:5-formyltetrahydrofolate cyclo-ligase [Amycolatopsis rhizosphaerae]|uniref:5-formyltetrahydrofolate cyclo-ligase n=1 Tax=Amycolatopsis rhizosphaerae TaxID=2053003 RepID=A0A558CS86_9PSEU|nr:5-formyltetrahydrofolate cyclo-ligase [Amycolatopsis rhizosphaerae]TVT51628.1 5-formyltetrahydrofolate cyclo-ligase [Amycolatopsis rhizosphaerae]
MCAGRNVVPGEAGGRPGDEALGKNRWRKLLKASRASISLQQRISEARALNDALRALALPSTVCAYVPFGTEPGSIAWLDLLRGAGARVLLPVIPPEPGPLHWAEYTGTASLAPGRLRGVLEPTGPLLGPEALGEAGLVLLPALAVDRSGVRLGRGAGYYDRSLPHVRPGAALTAVVRDDELVDHLPAEPHDVLMTAALTPCLGLVTLREN